MHLCFSSVYITFEANAIYYWHPVAWGGFGVEDDAISRKHREIWIWHVCAWITEIPSLFWCLTGSLWFRHTNVSTEPNVCYKNCHVAHWGICAISLLRINSFVQIHYNDVIMSAMASQITSLTIVYPAVYSGADQRKHYTKAPRHWPLCGEFTGDLWIPHTNVQ